MIYRSMTIPRYKWQEKLEELGMYYHSVDGKSYWNEAAYYSLPASFVDRLEEATQELHDMCMDFVADEVKDGSYRGYGFSDTTKFLIERSWDKLMPHVYGRFDLGVSPDGDIKMFEYNADTPTSLLEAAVVQWNWKQDSLPDADQFNSIHEKLIERWKQIDVEGNTIYFTTMKHGPYEDWGNVHYIMETAHEAGHKISSIDLEEIGWDGHYSFVDSNNKPIKKLFKLYPWEWMMGDEYAEHIKVSHTIFFEPPWKMLLSNKLLCAKLWNRHKEHPLLLEAHEVTEGTTLSGDWYYKPKLGREGAGIETSVPHSHKQYVAQRRMSVIELDGKQPVIGSWVIGNDPAGVGIREDVGITTNNSQFVPHVII